VRWRRCWRGVERQERGKMSEIVLPAAVEYLRNHIDAAPLQRFHFATHFVLNLHLVLQSPAPLPQAD